MILWNSLDRGPAPVLPRVWIPLSQRFTNFIHEFKTNKSITHCQHAYISDWLGSVHFQCLNLGKLRTLSPEEWSCLTTCVSKLKPCQRTIITYWITDLRKQTCYCLSFLVPVQIIPEDKLLKITIWFRAKYKANPRNRQLTNRNC